MFVDIEGGRSRFWKFSVLLYLDLCYCGFVVTSCTLVIVQHAWHSAFALLGPHSAAPGTSFLIPSYPFGLVGEGGVLKAFTVKQLPWRDVHIDFLSAVSFSLAFLHYQL